MRKLFTFLLTLLSLNIFCQNSFFNQYLANTVSINFDGSSEGGSAFFYQDSSRLFLVTAKHVLFSKNKTSGKNELKYKKCKLNFHTISKDSLIKHDAEIDLMIAKGFNLIKFSNDRDIVAIYIGNSIERDSATKAEKEGDYTVNFIPFVYSSKRHPGALIHLSRKMILKKVSEGSEILICGFPRTIGFSSKTQFDPERPILRKGIVAAINQKKKTIIIDAASFGGNSGGAVIQKEANKYKLIGIVIENIPVSPEGRYVGNSGYSVVEPITSLLKLIENEE